MQQQKKEKPGKDIQQTAAEMMIKIEINDDYDEGAWWERGRVGWGGVEKRFVFKM